MTELKEKAINHVLKDIDEAITKVKFLLQKISIPKATWICFLDKIEDDKIKHQYQTAQILTFALICHIFGKEQVPLADEDRDLYAKELSKLIKICGEIVADFGIIQLIDAGALMPSFNKNGKLLLSEKELGSEC